MRQDLNTKSQTRSSGSHSTDRAALAATELRGRPALSGEGGAGPTPRDSSKEPGRRALDQSLQAARQRASGRLAQQAVAFERLLGIGQEIALLDLDGALRAILEHLLELSGARRAAVYLVDPEDRLAFRAGMEKGRLELGHEEFPASRSAVRQAASSNTIVACDDLRSSPQNRGASAVALGLRALVAVPLQRHGQVLGVLYLDSDRPTPARHFRDPTVLQAFAAQAAVAIGNAQHFESLREDHFELHRRARGNLACGQILYRSAAMHRVCNALLRVAEREMTVLIEGETGTGKELVAREVHGHSLRRNQPFLSLNVGALPDELIESELFGHRRGAFTGAMEHHQGLFTAADGGTLFLDEIGEASPAMQVRLLQFLETGTFRRLGETRLRQADVRLIAATHRDLQEEVRQGRFRADLYYRLHVYPLRLPPLRQRPEDLEVLVPHFVQQGNAALGTQVSTVPNPTYECLRRRQWPGNVRELQHTVQRWMLQSPGRELLPIAETDPVLDAPHRNRTAAEEAHPSHGQPSLDSATTDPAEWIRPLETMERDYLSKVLQFLDGNQSEAARRLGLKRSTLRSRLQKLGLV